MDDEGYWKREGGRKGLKLVLLNEIEGRDLKGYILDTMGTIHLIDGYVVDRFMGNLLPFKRLRISTGCGILRTLREASGIQRLVLPTLSYANSP